MDGISVAGFIANIRIEDSMYLLFVVAVIGALIIWQYRKKIITIFK